MVSAMRLTDDDLMFLRARDAIGISVVNQMVWIFDEALDEAAVDRLHTRLAAGRLARVVRRPRVPGARPSWASDHGSLPLRRMDVPHRDILAWVDDESEVDVDPLTGPGWRLSEGRFTDGRVALCLTASHVVADGLAQLLAVYEAAVDAPAALAPSPRPRRREDVQDVLTSLRRLPGELRGPATSPSTPGQSSADTPLPAPADDDATPCRAGGAAVSFAAEDWDRAARADGGSTNSLLAGIAAEIVVRAGRAEAGAPVKVALPMTTRVEGDERANATSAVTVGVHIATDEAGEPYADDLAEVRRDSRAAFAARSAAAPDASNGFGSLLALSPGALVRSVSEGAPAPLVLATSFGAVPDEIITIAGPRASAGLARVVTHGATKGSLRRRRGGLSTWFNDLGGVATLTFAGLDPDRLGDRDTLSRHALAALSRRGIDATAW